MSSDEGRARPDRRRHRGAEEIREQPVAQTQGEKPGCWSRTAIPIARSQRCETFLLELVGFTTAVCPSASPSIRSSGAPSRR